MSHLISSKKKRTAGVTETERTKMRKISHFRKFCNLHSLKIENYDSLQLKSFLKKNAEIPSQVFSIHKG